MSIRIYTERFMLKYQYKTNNLKFPGFENKKWFVEVDLLNNHLLS